MSFRPIDISAFAAVTVPASLGRPPRLEWIAISDLVIDPSYQREITARGRANVRRIAAEFSWAMFSIVVVAPAGSGKFAIVDGQHHTTAAALCGLDKVPCAIIDAERAMQARAFKAINGNVTKTHTLHLHHAGVAAGEAGALRIADVCNRAGVTIVRNPTQASLLKPGETCVVSTIGRAIDRFGDGATVTGLKTIVSTGGGQSGPFVPDDHLGRGRGSPRSPGMVRQQRQGRALRRLRRHRSGGDLAQGDRGGGTGARIVNGRSIRGPTGRSAKQATGEAEG